MGRILLLGGAVIVLAGASIAWSAVGGDGPRQDSLVGGGMIAPGCSDGPVPFCPALSREFSIDAHATPGGGAAYGTFLYGVPELGSTSTVGRVTCLHVEGSSAVAGGIIQESATPALVGGSFFVYMTDVGRAGATARDRASAAFVDLPGAPGTPEGFPRVCAPLDNNAFDSGYRNLTAGDVQITDAS